MQAENGSKLISIINKCTQHEAKATKVQNFYQHQMQDLNVWSDVVGSLSATMKDLENCQPHLITSAYEYHEDIEKEQKMIARDITVEFKRDMLDPTRKVVEWERKMAKRRQRRQEENALIS